MTPTNIPPVESIHSGRARTLLEDQNVRAVIASYDALLAGSAGGHFVPDYRDHSATVPTGDLAGLIAYVAGFQAQFPMTRIELLRVLVDGDFVTVHSRARRDPREPWTQIMEIYRLDGGLIAEHWQVIEGATA